MKKYNIYSVFVGLCFLFYNPFTALADSDGSLQLNSDIITAQSKGEGGNSEFAIRAKLFSNELTKKTQEKAKNAASIPNYINDINFDQRHVNKLYQENYQSLKSDLFKNYNQTHIGTTELEQSSEKKSLLLLLILALPLMILTGLVARSWTRRKRRKG